MMENLIKYKLIFEIQQNVLRLFFLPTMILFYFQNGKQSSTQQSQHVSLILHVCWFNDPHLITTENCKSSLSIAYRLLKSRRAVEKKQIVQKIMSIFLLVLRNRKAVFASPYTCPYLLKDIVYVLCLASAYVKMKQYDDLT